MFIDSVTTASKPANEGALERETLDDLRTYPFWARVTRRSFLQVAWKQRDVRTSALAAGYAARIPKSAV